MEELFSQLYNLFLILVFDCIGSLLLGDRGLSLVAVSGGYSLVVVHRLLIAWLLIAVASLAQQRL